MSRRLKCLVLIISCILQVQLSARSSIAAQPATDPLTDLKKALYPTIEHNKLSWFHHRPIELTKTLYESRWRFSVRQAIRLLVTSDSPKDRLIGWKLAFDADETKLWKEADIEKLLTEPDEDVKQAGIRSVSKTDSAWLARIIERVLKDPTSSEQCQGLCVAELENVPVEAERIRLWLLASDRQELRGACLFAFPAVKSSTDVVKKVLTYLDDDSTVNVAISDDFGSQVEIRVLACQVLSAVHELETLVADEIWKKSSNSPRLEDLSFLVSAMTAIQALQPDSTLPEERIAHWYAQLPAARAVLLQEMTGQLADAVAFESQVIDHISELTPSQKCCLCQWLSGRESPRAKQTLIELLDEPHAGVRVAAAVGMAKVDPLFDLSTMREELLASAVTSPEEFELAFDSLSFAVAALALAGQSDEEAVNWLKMERSPELKTLVDDAIEEVSLHQSLGWERHIYWKTATIDQE